MRIPVLLNFLVLSGIVFSAVQGTNEAIDLSEKGLPGRTLFLEDFGGMPDSEAVGGRLASFPFFFPEFLSTASPEYVEGAPHISLSEQLGLSHDEVVSLGKQNADAFNAALKMALPGDRIVLKDGESYTLIGGIIGRALDNVTVDFAGFARWVYDTKLWPYNEGDRKYLAGFNIVDSKNVTLTCSSQKRAKVVVRVKKNEIFLDDSIKEGWVGGIIDGQGKPWWDDAIAGSLPRAGDCRPRLFHIESSADVLVEHLTLVNSPFWTLTVEAIRAEVSNVNVLVDRNYQRKLRPQFDASVLYSNSNISTSRRLLRGQDAGETILEDTLSSPHFPSFLPNWVLQPENLNTDGIDPRGTDIWIHDCIVLNDDDSIAVKPPIFGRKTTALNGRLSYECTKNVTVENVVLTGFGASVGSVGPSVDHNCVDNITFRNVTMPGTGKGIYIKSNKNDCNGNETSQLTNIRYENIFIKEPAWWSIWIGPQAMHTPHTKLGGWCPLTYPIEKPCPTQACALFENITLKDVYIDDPLVSPGVILGNASNPIKNLVFDNVTTRSKGVYGKLPFYSTKHGKFRGRFQCEHAQGTVKNSFPAPFCLTKI